MAKYRKLPVVIDAIKYMGDNADEIIAFASEGGAPPPYTYNGQLMIATREGVMAALVGDWVIRGIEGEIYPCKPQIFAQTYEEVQA